MEALTESRSPTRRTCPFTPNAAECSFFVTTERLTPPYDSVVEEVDPMTDFTQSPVFAASVTVASTRRCVGTPLAAFPDAGRFGTATAS